MDRNRIENMINEKVDVGEANLLIIKHLVYLSDNSGLIVASHRDIANAVNKSLSTIHSVIGKLIAANCLEMLRGGVYKLRIGDGF